MPLCEEILLSARSRVAAKTNEVGRLLKGCQLVPNVPVIGVTRSMTRLSGLVMLAVRGTAGQVMAAAGRWQVP